MLIYESTCRVTLQVEKERREVGAGTFFFCYYHFCAHHFNPYLEREIIFLDSAISFMLEFLSQILAPFLILPEHASYFR